MSAERVVWRGWPGAPAPIAAIRAARRRDAAALVVDDAGKIVRVTPFLLLWELVRGLWQRLLDLPLGVLGRLLGRRRPPMLAEALGPGPVVLVVPVLPDLSHTFVYREVLAILRQRPDWRVVALSRNDAAPVHTEAAELMAKVVFLPRDAVTRRAVRLLLWLLRPAGRRLFGLYAEQPDGSATDLLGKLPLRDPRHPGNAFALADFLAPLQPRCLHVYSSTWPANVVMGAAMLLGVPWSLSSYVDFEFAYSNKMLGEKLARSRFFRVVTGFCRQRLLQMPGLPPVGVARVPVVYLGLDLVDWQHAARAPGRGILVSAARLVPKKGLQHVPAALAILRARGFDVHWRVLGDGPELTALQQACELHGVAADTTFLGPCDNARVREELRSADAALLPCILAEDGERDGIPIFLCEAMALGVPVVSTPVSGIPELVKHLDTGYLAVPADSVDLAHVLEQMLSDPTQAAQIAARARDVVQKQLDVHARAADLIRCIEA